VLGDVLDALSSDVDRAAVAEAVEVLLTGEQLAAGCVRHASPLVV
jgi:hypothetical protein